MSNPQHIKNKRRLSPAHVERLRLLLAAHSYRRLSRILGTADESLHGGLTGALFIHRVAERLERAIDDATEARRAPAEVHES